MIYRCFEKVKISDSGIKMLMTVLLSIFVKQTYVWRCVSFTGQILDIMQQGSLSK